jgi:hypothetical protein
MNEINSHNLQHKEIPIHKTFVAQRYPVSGWQYSFNEPLVARSVNSSRSVLSASLLASSWNPSSRRGVLGIVNAAPKPSFKEALERPVQAYREGPPIVIVLPRNAR